MVVPRRTRMHGAIYVLLKGKTFVHNLLLELTSNGLHRKNGSYTSFLGVIGCRMTMVH